MRATDLLRSFVLPIVPARFELPLRYVYTMLKGKLEPEVEAVRRLVVAGHRFVDIGAHYGHWSYGLCKYFDKVDAFEPQLECARVIRSAGMTNVTVHEVGLSDKSATARLVLPVVDGRPRRGLATFEMDPSSTGTEAPVVPLDSFNFNDVSLVKIDVEGHEDSVLRGAVETLRRSAPVLVVEIERRHRPRPPEDVFRFLSALGYEAFFLDPERGIASAADFSWERYQSTRVLGTDQYVNNFIFQHRDRLPRSV